MRQLYRFAHKFLLGAAFATCSYRIQLDTSASESIAATTQLPLSHPPKRIHYAGGTDELLQSAVLSPQNTLIIYEMSGDKFVDDQMIAIAEQFMAKYQKHASRPFEFVFFEPGEKEPFLKNSFVVISSNQKERYVHVDDYLVKEQFRSRKVDMNELFESMLKKICNYKQVNTATLHEQLARMEKETDSPYIVTFARDNLSEAAKCLDEVAALRTCKFIISDDHTRKVLGVPENSEGKVFIIAPRNINLKDQRNLYSIGGSKYTIFQAKDALQKQVFPSVASSATAPLALSVLVDRNSISDDVIMKIYEQMGKGQLSTIPKHLLFTSEDNNSVSIEISSTDFSNKIMRVYEPNCQFSQQEKLKLLKESQIWRYPLEMNNLGESLRAERIQQWIETVQANPHLKQYYRSQTSEDRFSIELTGESFLQAKASNEDKIFYYYTPFCASCKKVSPLYEKLAKEYAGKIGFYRINTKENYIPFEKNYLATPTFVFFKKGLNHPFQYKIATLHRLEELFNNFLTVHQSIGLIPETQLEAAVMNRQKGEALVKQLLAGIK